MSMDKTAEWTNTDEHGRLDLREPEVRTFAHLLVNVTLVSVMNFTAWFAVTFWVYLETGSVFATGTISGIFLVAMAATACGSGRSSTTTARRP